MKSIFADKELFLTANDLKKALATYAIWQPLINYVMKANPKSRKNINTRVIQELKAAKVYAESLDIRIDVKDTSGVYDIKN